MRRIVSVLENESTYSGFEQFKVGKIIYIKEEEMEENIIILRTAVSLHH